MIDNESVILLHGLARSEKSMAVLANALEKIGYQTVNCRYPSTKYVIPLLAEKTIKNALGKCVNVKKIHFVTHSMGGILVRQYLRENSIDNMGRVVMLGPPNQGSQVVDKIKKIPGFKQVNGPAGMQLGTEASSVPNSLGAANFELGVIAGTRSINLILSTMLPGKNDGKVTVENTILQGMSDHIALPVTHPFMMRNRNVISQVIYFLQRGSFK